LLVDFPVRQEEEGFPPILSILLGLAVAYFTEPAYRPNPGRPAYYRRLVHQKALERIGAIEDALATFDTSHTGKVYRDEEGTAIGRGKGLMPSLQMQFPEVSGETPAKLRRAIKKKTPEFFRLLGDAEQEVDRHESPQLEKWISEASTPELRTLPPVVYPAHKGLTKKCKHCGEPHRESVHQSHMEGAFKRTHPTAEEKKRRAAERRQLAERLNEVPF